MNKLILAGLVSGLAICVATDAFEWWQAESVVAPRAAADHGRRAAGMVPAHLSRLSTSRRRELRLPGQAKQRRTPKAGKAADIRLFFTVLRVG